MIGEPISEELKVIDAGEREALCAQIEANKYVRRTGKWQFRRGWGVGDFFLRILTLLMLFFISYFAKPGTPRGREDREWLIIFSLTMMIWFAALHVIAYLPATLFGGFSEMTAALRGNVSHAIEHWRDY